MSLFIGEVGRYGDGGDRAWSVVTTAFSDGDSEGDNLTCGQENIGDMTMPVGCLGRG